MILNLRYKILNILQRHVTLHVLISSEFWQPNILLTFMTILPPSLVSSIFKCWRLVRRFKLFYIVLWFSHHLKREYIYKLGLILILYVAFINNLISKITRNLFQIGHAIICKNSYTQVLRQNWNDEWYGSEQ